MLQYSWTNDRLWRKNRREQLLCTGVDLNRNFNDHWSEVSNRLITYVYVCQHHSLYLGG